ncbi:conserved hypothetical protein [Leishmania mexicana MHOM/GT/2001/U1103]|uniref:Uncharacterized protein n=1 Tax=Leishmania mexicana (strain MHOM/GT/2001/U1103) TaxID=929439 RepID=E9ATL1_LEIMU|nr:conserved hypothetical protein [Leishmania mexicana MHOM/GT/2001/U1103]CBZ26285.1 conserved hypothetical protein [Leishmania mexicana MHOM/GT/2001/U1103]
MLGTLFFDESRVSTAFRARVRQQAGASHELSATRHGLSNTSLPVSATHDGVARLHDGGGLVPAHGCTFSCRGEVALPSLQAALLWWLDADVNVVQLLVMNNTQSSKAARSCQSRLLTVELPVASPENLVTCGVTRSYMGDNGVAVVWVQRGVSGDGGEEVLCPGFAHVTVQREADNTGHSNLLLYPDDRVVQCAPLSRVSSSFFQSALACSGSAACVVAALPDDATQHTISIVVLTDGSRVWRAELFADGTTAVSGFRDEYRRNMLRSFCDGNEEVRLLDTRSVVADLQRLASPPASNAPSFAESGAEEGSTSPRGSTWIRRLLGSGGRAGANVVDGGDGAASGVVDVALSAVVRKRLYAAVTAVQQSWFVALTRWNGQLEVYDTARGTLKLTQTYPIGILPQTILRPIDGGFSGRGAKALDGKSQLCALPPGPLAQWATLCSTTQLLHVVSCCSGGGGRACFWSALPPLAPSSSRIVGFEASDAGEILAQHCTLSVAPPTQSSFPLACAVTSDGRKMILVSEVGTEEDGHLLCTRTLGALTLRCDHAHEDGVATVLQVMEAGDGTGFGDLLRTGRMHGYLCQGARMQSVVAQDNAVFVVERGPQACRLVLQACPHGSRLMSDLLQDVLLATTPIARLSSLPRFLSEAHLSGYTAALQRNATTTKASVCSAIRMALLPPATAAAGETAHALYRFSRLYATHATLGELLSRITFLTTTYLGWQSTYSVAHALSSTGEDDATLSTADWVSHQLITALEVLVAAYHAVPAAGADLVQLALVDDSSSQPSSNAIVAALLPTLTDTAGCDDDSVACGWELSTLSMIQVANRLLRCGTPSMARARAVWVKQLTHRFPLLQHYQLLSLLETAAVSTQSERAIALCERVCQALAREAPGDLTTALLLEGLLLTDVSGPGSAFLQLSLDEVAAFLAADPTLGPKLYAVGVLRRTISVGSLQTCMSHCVTHRYMYTTLATCVEAVERMHRCASVTASTPTLAPFSQLRRALEELQVDALLASAFARVSGGDIASCFHDVQTALDLIARHKCLPSYAELLQVILSHIVEVACASQASMNALLRATTIGAAQLEESLILRWYNYIARLPTKSATEATEALRYRAIMGLHRYLMNRHDYAQCARLMSSLATLIRCSPLRRSASAGISVSELAGLALHAAEMIAPSAPMPETAGGEQGETSQAAPQGASHDPALMVGSPLSLGYSWQPSASASPAPFDLNSATLGATARGPRWLTRADIPCLRRRLYQAHCERQLWRRGCTLDCTDLWVEGAPADAYQAGVEKLVAALMQARLWPQAFRFACLSAVYDPCTVLAEWAVNLLRAPREYGSDDIAAAEAAHADLTTEWTELIGYCGEISNLENQFYAYVRTVTAALTFAYSQVPTALLEAHRAADAYTAMTTLFHVALMLRRQVEAVELGQQRNEEDGEDKEDADEFSSSSSNREAGRTAADHDAEKRDEMSLEDIRCNVWRAWCASARIGIDMVAERQPRPAAAALYGRTVGTMRGAGDVVAEEDAAQIHSDVVVAGTVSTASSAARRTFSAFTAGALDPMAVCASELLRIPAYRASLNLVARGEATVRQFQDLMGRPCS